MNAVRHTSNPWRTLALLVALGLQGGTPAEAGRSTRKAPEYKMITALTSGLGGGDVGRDSDGSANNSGEVADDATGGLDPMPGAVNGPPSNPGGGNGAAPRLAGVPGGADDRPGDGGITPPKPTPAPAPVPTPAPTPTSPAAAAFELAGPVQPGNFDLASQAFRDTAIQTAMGQGWAGQGVISLDPEKLRLKIDADIRAYFVGENSELAGSLGYRADGSEGGTTTVPRWIFPNVSMPTGAVLGGNGILRTMNEPLLPGDFVDLGSHRAGTLLEFFLLADGARGGTTRFSTHRASNPDGLSHVAVLAYARKDSPYLLLGFEGLLGGGERDLLVALDIGSVNVAALTATPEPSTWATMAVFLGLGYWLRRRTVAGGRGVS